MDMNIHQKMFLNYFTLLNWVCYIASASSIGRFFSPIGEPFFVFGIGSACYQRPLNQSKEMNMKARFHDKAVDYFFYERDNIHPLFRNRRLFFYQYFDVCSDNENLTSLLVDFLLNPKYTILEDPSPKAKRKIYGGKNNRKY